MKTIEIYEKKGAYYFTIIFFPLLVLGFAYYVFLSGNSQVTKATQFTFVMALTYSMYKIYVALKKRKKNEPTLIISEFSIEIFGDFKRSLYLWQEIRNWKIELDEGIHYLVLETHEVKKSISIEGLEKTPAEIEEIIAGYK